MLAKLKLEGKPSVEVPEELKNKCVPYCCTNSAYDLTIFVSRTGTANRILEAKEKEREKDKGKGKEKARKKAKR